MAIFGQAAAHGVVVKLAQLLSDRAHHPTADLAVMAKLQKGKVPPAKQVTFSSIDYDENGVKSVVRINGYAAPGTNISLYIDNEPVGTATADATGRWSFAANRELADGNHAMRADAVEAPSGKVITRAEVSFNRELPKPDVAVAEAQEKTMPPFGPDASATTEEADEEAASTTRPLQGRHLYWGAKNVVVAGAKRKGSVAARRNRWVSINPCSCIASRMRRWRAISASRPAAVR